MLPGTKGKEGSVLLPRAAAGDGRSLTVFPHERTKGILKLLLWKYNLKPAFGGLDVGLQTP